MTNDDRNSLTADQNKPASPGDVNEVHPRKAGCTEQEEKAEPLPDLTRLYKRRCRDESVIKKAKSLLVHGMTVNKVALLLRLPLEKVQQLHSEGWNSRCRRVTRINAYQNAKLALTSFNEGATLAEICQALGLPLYTVVMSLRQNGVAESAIQARFPSPDDPLTLAYNIVVTRKSASRFKPVKLFSNRCKLNPATVATTQRTSSQTATA
ncbi:TPA: hypothetical protein ACP56Q_002083 [Klebsiella quasipneumoniae]|uniref:hypothetical protein n=1 Tax=Enterobacteriaceae TaxID=543 RepID=UPI000BA24F93|nr:MULTISPECIES: hypothetical protein [Enterobacteriaceae]MDM9660369.1 hypothetical protein [Raoultella planticola]OZZ64835.1 hypothetical protein CDA25_04190 [Klebsiella pneumoniae]HDH1414241.1 hypothetical protein [Klebsiella quasipneumoniae subsp. similipneumoniae]ELT0795755.1 hypothetical protein [Klebsiella quasipneumoniae]MDM9665499.1 hypothetical protein [Raoultella planticola]